MHASSILHSIQNSFSNFRETIKSVRHIITTNHHTNGKHKEDKSLKPGIKYSGTAGEKKEARNVGTSSEQQEQTRRIVAEAATKEQTGESTPDVFLDVPTLKIDEIKLNVENLDAQVALRAELANLVKINVGVSVGIDKLDLDLKGVDAQAVLKVRLKQVYAILNRALESLDNNPNLLSNLQSEAVKNIRSESGRKIRGKESGADIPQQTVNKDEQNMDVKGALNKSSTNNSAQDTAKEITVPKELESSIFKDAGNDINKSIEGAKTVKKEKQNYWFRKNK